MTAEVGTQDAETAPSAFERRPLSNPFVAVVGYTLRACLPARRWVGVLLPCAGALLFGWLATAAGLFAIDWFASANTWWYWPVMWSGVAVALIAGAIWTRGRPWVGMLVLGGAALALALVVTDLVTGAPAWWFYPVAAIIATWLVHFFLTMDLPRMLGASTHRERP